MFDMDLNAKDKNGQTIVHYATRNGYLGILLYLQDFSEVDFGALTSTGMSATIYAMIYQKVYTFVFMYFIKG
jgi:ankyrin repeat protein